ncbi:MAG: DMT family transporter [Pseudomonadota bacterium]
MSYLNFLRLHMLDTARRGMIYGLFGFLCFSLNDVIVKQITTTLHYHPLFIIFVSSCMMMGVLLLAAPRLGGWKATFQTRKPGLHLARSLLMLPTAPLIIYAFAHIPLSTGYAVIMLTPLIVTMIARFWMGEHHGKHVYALILLGFIGVLVSLRPGHSDFGLPVLALSCGVCFSAMRVTLLRKGHAGETPLSMIFYPCLSLLLVYAIPAYIYAPQVTFGVLAILACCGLFLAGGFIFTQAAYRIAPAAYAGITHYSQIIWGILFGWLFFASPPDALTLIGAAIIATSGVLLIWQTRPHNPNLPPQTA